MLGWSIDVDKNKMKAKPKTWKNVFSDNKNLFINTSLFIKFQ
jgi:hypothetical protein